MDEQQLQEQREAMYEKVTSCYRDGQIVIATAEGLTTMNLTTCIEQPIDKLLYDLNRDELTISLTISMFLADPKWVNDFASTQVIRALYEQRAALRAENALLQEALKQNES
jgi:hypothetical protein